MELSDILSKECVVACANVASKRQLLQKLADKAAEVTGAKASDIFETLMNRERLGSTGLGNGIAIPHGKLPKLSGVTAVFARLDHAIDFDSIDDQPVDLVMMLLAPEGSGADHLKALARVARLLRTDAMVAQLRASRDPETLYEIITGPVDAHVAA